MRLYVLSVGVEIDKFKFLIYGGGEYVDDDEDYDNVIVLSLFVR